MSKRVRSNKIFCKTSSMKAVALLSVGILCGMTGCTGEDKEEIANTVEEVVQEEDTAMITLVPESTDTQTGEEEQLTQDTSEDVLYQTMYVVNCQESITLRTEATTKASEICQIPLGAPVSYVETAENGFYKVIYNGKTGYALASYLDLEYHDTHQVNKPSSEAISGNLYKTTVPAQVYTTMYVVNCQESITLRTSPSTKASEICQIPLGAAVSYVEYAGNDFNLIVYNGKVGYSLASYLESPYGQLQSYVDDYLRVINCNESITLRNAPSTSAGEICQIPLGATVEFVALAGDGFYKVAYNGHVGYALASYLY